MPDRYPKISQVPALLGFLWDSTRGYRLRPWKSPYLRWRVETYCGIPADSLNREDFWAFNRREKKPLVHFLAWAAAMRRSFGT